MSRLKKLSNSFWVAAGILLSRFSGLIRERVFAHYFGQSDAGDAFKAGLKIPNFLQNLFGEGVLSASFIPVYSRLLIQQKEDLQNTEADKVASAVASLLFLAVSLMVVFGVLLTPFLIHFIAPGFTDQKKELTIQIVQILFPGVGLLVLSAWCLGVLNSHSQFFLSYVAPVIWNAALILSLVLFAEGRSLNELALILSWGLVLGSFLQMFVQLPMVFKLMRTFYWSLDFKNENVKKIFKSFLPVVMSRGVLQVSSYVDNMLASFLATGAVSSLAYVQTIYMLPVSLFGMSVSAAELPELAKMQAGSLDENKKQTLHLRLLAGLENILFFIIPTVIVLILFPSQVVTLLYRTGAFDEKQVSLVSALLAVFSVGLLVTTQSRLLASFFYSLQRQSEPLKWALLRVVLSILVASVFIFWGWPSISDFVQPLLIYYGVSFNDLQGQGLALALGSIVGAFAEYFFLKKAYEKHMQLKIYYASFLRTFCVAILAAGIAEVFRRSVYGFGYWLDSFVVLLAFGLSYFIFALLFKLEKALQIYRKLGLRI